MAQLTALGRLKLLFNGDGVSVGVEPKDPFHCNQLTSLQRHGLRLRFSGSTRIYSSHAVNRGTSFGSDGRWSVGDESVYSDNLADYDDEDEDEDGNFEDEEEEDDDDDDGDDEFVRDELACFRGLVLDIAYRPINVVCWKRAICLEFMEKADVLEYYDQTVNSPSGSFYIPAVLRIRHLLQVVKRRRVKNHLSRKNLLFRDGYMCQYCSSKLNLTIDHIHPVARGGQWTWENLVTACAKCNSRKGQKTLEEANMKLVKVPKAPKEYEILAIPLTTSAIRMLQMRQGTPEEWRQYLPQR